MAKTWRAWRIREIFYLRDNIDKPLAELADYLNRSYDSVKSKRIEIGLTKNKSRLFLEEELNYIIENHKSKTLTEIGRSLGRTPSTIYSKINQLKAKEIIQ